MQLAKGDQCMQVDYTYTLPYTGTFLRDPLSYPVSLIVNDALTMRWISVYDDMDIEQAALLCNGNDEKTVGEVLDLED